MNRIKIHTYKLNNIEDVFDDIAQSTFFVTSSEILNRINKQSSFENEFATYDYFDISLLISGDYERIDAWIGAALYFIQEFIKAEAGNDDKYVIVDKRYASNLCANLPYFISGTTSLEEELGIDKKRITNVVDLDESAFEDLQRTFDQRLFGNRKFKRRLFEELSRYRKFNYIGERKIFSVFLCGPSGIGKTETAWILHDALASGERSIKINLGNYSEHNALSSLIGSPRGYIGSSKGELSDKIESSKSTIILIDEFEKASKEIHNFFLELLSDGTFTDSLGREFDLDKYIVIFTSNLNQEEIDSSISPELWSRFDLKYNMVKLSSEEKLQYIEYKANYYSGKIKKAYNLDDGFELDIPFHEIDVDKFDNLRKLNRALEGVVSKRMEELTLKKP